MLELAGAGLFKGVLMTTTDQIKAWCEWTRQYLCEAQEIPSVEDGDLAVPWKAELGDIASEYADCPDTLLQILTDAVRSNPPDTPTRFTVLHVLFLFKTQRAGEDELFMRFLRDMLEDEEEGAIDSKAYDEAWAWLAKMGRNLPLVVRLLKPTDVPAEWRFLKWEISNSYSIADWPRALELYNRAEQAPELDRAQLNLLRGQFRFLWVFGPKMDKEFNLSEWEPKLYQSDPLLRDLLLFAWGSLHQNVDLTLDDSELERLRHARTDLENGLAAGGNPWSPYRWILARACFSLGHFHEAASHYHNVLESLADHVALHEPYLTLRPFLRRTAFESLAECYRHAEETAKVITTLEQFAEEYRDEKGVYLQIAELQAQQSNYDRILQSIRREQDRSPDVDQDWRISSLIALGESHDVSRAIVSALKSDQIVYHATTSLLSTYWPAFDRLGSEAREEWIAGTLFWNNLPGVPMRDVLLRKGALAFATAVEIELRVRVFEGFRTSIETQPELRQTEEPGRPDDAQRLRKFVLKRGTLTLLQMASIVNQNGRQRKGILGQFDFWLTRRYPKLALQIKLLLDIGNFRNSASHDAKSKATLKTVPQWCRTIIEILTEQTQ